MSRISINLSTGSLQKEEMIVGIDLGTTNSLVSIIHPDTKQPIALKEHNSSSIVPSIIYFDENARLENMSAVKEDNIIIELQNLNGNIFPAIYTALKAMPDYAGAVDA